MKKIINLIIVLMIFVLTACSNTNGNYYLIKIILLLELYRIMIKMMKTID